MKSYLFNMVVKRNRMPSKYVGYGLYLHFLGLSYRNTSKAYLDSSKEVMYSVRNGCDL